MYKKLTNTDYKKILTYYKILIPANNRLLKEMAEQILSNKLCKCIKKNSPKYNSKSIGICTKSVLNNKGITRGAFKCLGKRNITLKKQY
jgi:uncharacterized protein (DUF488 family)